MFSFNQGWCHWKVYWIDCGTTNQGNICKEKTRKKHGKEENRSKIDLTMVVNHQKLSHIVWLCSWLKKFFRDVETESNFVLVSLFEKLSVKWPQIYCFLKYTFHVWNVPLWNKVHFWCNISNLPRFVTFLFSWNTCLSLLCVLENL